MIASISKNRLAPAEWIALAISVLMAHGFFLHRLHYPSCCDAVSYVEAAYNLAMNGVSSKYALADLRTYAYPLFLSVVLDLARLLRLPLAPVVFEVQLCLYLLASLALRQVVARQSLMAARICFTGVVINYYCLMYTPETLTESLSLSLLLLAVTCWLILWKNPNRLIPLIAGTFTVGLAMMVRPANLYLAMAWIGSCALLFAARSRAQFLLPRILIVGLFLAIPAAPQIINNIRFYDAVTPFVVVDLGRKQQEWGIQYLKYATTMQSVERHVFYNNPFSVDRAIDPEAPWKWYLQNPFQGFVTVALHAFNLTDQDLLFTYSYDLNPWYRVPLGFLNHAIIAAGIFGFFLFGRAMFAAPDRRLREIYVSLILLLTAHLAIHSVTAVEMRFGLALLLVLFPLAGHAILHAASQSPKMKLSLAAFTVTYAVIALVISDWVRSQAPLIAAASAN